MMAEALYYSRMALGIRQYLRTRRYPDPGGGHPASIGEPGIHLPGHGSADRSSRIRATLTTRCSGWPAARSRIWSGPSPRSGLETALGVLHRQGIYLTHDEFKGKAAIVRSGRHIPADPASFRNPLGSGLMVSTTSGSRSKGTRTPLSTKIKLYREAQTQLRDRELGLGGYASIEVEAHTALHHWIGGLSAGQAAGPRSGTLVRGRRHRTRLRPLPPGDAWHGRDQQPAGWRGAVSHLLCHRTTSPRWPNGLPGAAPRAQPALWGAIPAPPSASRRRPWRRAWTSAEPCSWSRARPSPTPSAR